MKEIIKKFAPEFVIKHLLVMKKNFYDPWEKLRLAKKVEHKHVELLKKLGSKEKKRVIFLVFFESVWKLDILLKKMLADSQFEPVILVCPYIVFGESRMNEEMQKCINFFKEKGYPVLSSFDNEKKKWITLDELKPDLVFFTNPHNLTRKEYYQDAYLNYLSCYVPYHYEVGQYDDNQAQYNQPFHNAIWKIFTPHKTSLSIFKDTCFTKGKNAELTGYPFAESLSQSIDAKLNPSVWKESSAKVRIIWAPHHTIDSPELPYSNFLKYAEFFKEISEIYKSEIQWCFKPHPILKLKLYNHPQWGIEKTDEYFNFWKNQKFTQLAEGDYIDLFIESTAMIHDSGSFLAEYLHVNKPVMYLINNENYLNFYNNFGKSALECCDLGRNKDDILKFINSLRSLTKVDEDILIKRNTAFFSRECPCEPSQKIIEILDREFKNASS
ncbi:hypothetical protein [Acinetobacter gerneri]|uniref:hypothetical protein n=1 Tax=Acinetobacter gerneri TaxID=202952 RepID=UPI003212C54E